MRASRLMSILLLLQIRGRMTAQEFADEFEVSVRTIYRDIDELSAAGIPVYAERGREGGFRLLDGYRTQLTGLAASEAEALLLSGLPGPASQLGLGEAIAAVQLKLLAALPEEKRAAAERVAARFHLDPVGWYRRPEPAGHLPVLADAVWTGRSIRIRYESWKGVVERNLDPLGLVLKAGNWYLVARAPGGVRTYRVAAILALEGLERRFDWPEDFGLAAYWSAWLADFETRLHGQTARVRLAPEALASLAALLPLAVETAGKAGPPDAEGWITISLSIENVDQAAADILRLGNGAEVLDPPDLRRRIAGIADDLARRYGRSL